MQQVRRVVEIVSDLVKLPVLGPDGEINVGPLLASEWWPQIWKHTEHGARIFQRDNRTLGDALAWYDEQIKEGWRPIWWIHSERGQLKYNDYGKKWRHVDYLANELEIKTGKKRWPIALGPIEGKAGELKKSLSLICLPSWEAQKVVLTGDEDVAKITSCRVGGKSVDLMFNVERADSVNMLPVAHFPPGKFLMGTSHGIEVEILFLRDGMWAGTWFGLYDRLFGG